MRQTILAAAMAAAFALTGAVRADPITSRTEPVQRVNYADAFASCSVSFVAVVTRPDGTPDMTEAVRGSFAVTHFTRDQFALTVKLGSVHRDRPDATLVYSAPVQIALMRAGRPVDSLPSQAIRSSDEPDYGIIAFPAAQRDTADLLIELSRSGQITFGYALNPGDALRTINLDISARENNTDPRARQAWRTCVADLMQTYGVRG